MGHIHIACILFYSKAKQVCSFCFLGGKQHLSEAISKQWWATAWTENRIGYLETSGFSHFLLLAVHSLHAQADWILYLVNPNIFRTWKKWWLKFSVCVHFIPAGHDWCCFLPGLHPGPHDGRLPRHADREGRSLLPPFCTVSTRVFCGWFHFHLPPPSRDASQGKTGKWTISLKICFFCKNRISEWMKYWKQWRTGLASVSEI